MHHLLDKKSLRPSLIYWHQLICGQSYEGSKIANYNSRVILTANFL